MLKEFKFPSLNKKIVVNEMIQLCIPFPYDINICDESLIFIFTNYQICSNNEVIDNFMIQKFSNHLSLIENVKQIQNDLLFIYNDFNIEINGESLTFTNNDNCCQTSSSSFLIKSHYQFHTIELIGVSILISLISFDILLIFILIKLILIFT
jgi:hypothetical protein